MRGSACGNVPASISCGRPSALGSAFIAIEFEMPVFSRHGRENARSNSYRDPDAAGVGQFNAL
jgi:hypothetical protein